MHVEVIVCTLRNRYPNSLVYVSMCVKYCMYVQYVLTHVSHTRTYVLRSMHQKNRKNT